MIYPTDLAFAFSLNLRMTLAATEGLTHADSLLQPAVPGNCLNWILGHMANTRNLVLKHLNQPPIMTEAQAKRYGNGSEPICGDGDDVIALGELLALLQKGQQGIEAGLTSVSAEHLAEEVTSFLGKTPRSFLLLVLFRHEAYHLGQTELLREQARAASGWALP